MQDDPAHPTVARRVLSGFLVHARRRPDAAALVQGRRALGYGEAGERVERLAARLRRRGVGPEVRVAVAMRRSPGQILAILGVLRAGGAYVPVDPDGPASRRERILTHSGAAMVLEDGGDVDRDAPPTIRELAPAGLLGDHTDAPPSESDAAYVIYTSGSGGAPKGVVVEHRALANHTDSAFRAYGLGPEDRLLQFASITFDASCEEIFPALAAGAQLHLLDAGRRYSFAELLATVAERRISVLNLPTALWHEMAASRAAALDLPGSLRLVIIGGEKASAVRLREWLRKARPGIRLVNTYGPTEASVVATRWTAPADPAQVDDRVPIGAPIDGVVARVLNAQLRPVADGEPGELCLGGAGLARGYLNEPGRTAARFVPDPLAPKNGAGSRLLRTGDRARVNAAGELEFLGRVDRQVKVRGHRVEPAEIEAVLLRQPEVADAAVCPAAAADTNDGDALELAAFLVAREQPLPASELRRRLRTRLPEPMVPADVAWLEELPRTVSGKTDLEALARLATERRAAAASPRRGGHPGLDTASERAIAAAMEALTGADRVGPVDDFFDLGGHSLLAMRLIGALRRETGVELPLQAVFEQRTPRTLAAVLDATAPSDELGPVPVPRCGPLPLSPSQERIWFLQQLVPDAVAYNTQDSLRLRGPLDVGALRAALDELVRRHEVLRTGFPIRDGHPVQRVHEPAPVDLEVIDLSDLPADERSAEAERRTAELVRRPFRLEEPPLVRWWLLRLAPGKHGEHVLLRAEHHLIHDGWSYNLYLDELAALYRAQVAGEPAPPQPALQFADYAVWQRDWLEGPDAARQLAYWREELDGAPALLPLPWDRPRSPVQQLRGGMLDLVVPAELAARLRALAGACDATTFMTMLAAFAALLGRYSGEDELCVGTAVANRRHPATESLLGMLVNNIVIRVDLEGDPDFRELLARVRARTLAGFAHQEVPFDRVVQQVRPDRHLSHNPLFQVMFSFHDAAPPRLEFSGLEAEAVDLVANGSSKFDLNLVVVPRAGGELRIGWEYDAALFDEDTVAAMARRYLHLLEAVAAAPDTRVSALPLEPAESDPGRRVAAAQTAPPAIEERTLWEVFAGQALRAPRATALIDGDRRLAYAELAAGARRVAERLRASGVGPESVVGLLHDRSAATLTDLLGVLAAGAAYLPLDPKHPDERLAFMVADADAALVLTGEEQRQRAADLGLPVQAGAGRTAGSLDAGPGNLAYVLYTSGSTGQPKGVAIEHRSALALVAWARDFFTDAETRAVLASTSLGFDLSVFELFAAWSRGGTVVLAEDALALADLPAAGDVTLLNTVPSAARELVALGAIPDGVRAVCLAGEPLPRELVDELYRLPGVERVLNLYGPSEDTTYSTVEVVPRGERRAPSIGVPLPGTRARVLDAHGRPVPRGVPGELWLGGAGVARGYRRRPALTADRFRPDPFADGAPGARLYRTGDRVRELPDGRLDFLGRTDHQAKIRGFRIEPGEIEHRLDALPEVAECVVRPLPGPGGDPRLVAWVAPARQPAEHDLVDSIRARLRASLPSYLVPGEIVLVARLPRTRNGKVDRRRLRAPAARDDDTPGSPPRTLTEAAVCKVWSALLGHGPVGIDDDFFDLGGHSLLVTRVASRIRTVLGVEVPLRTLFERRTVRSIAAEIEHRLRGGDSAPQPIPALGPGAPLEPSFAQERLWFLDQLEPDSAAYVMASAFRVRGPLRRDALETALHELVRRHEVLRTSFHSDGGRMRLAVADEATVSLPLLDLTAEPDPLAAARAWCAGDARRPFDLSAAPLLRTALLRLAGDDHVLWLAQHHVTSDGWSRSVLHRELGELYAAQVTGRPARLPALRVRYRDWAAWQRRQLRGAPLETHLAYWKEALAGLPQLELPTDHRRPARRASHGAVHPFALPETAAARLRAIAGEQGASLFMVLAAAVQVWLARYAGADDFALGTPIANRTRQETEGLIGFFVNLLVLRADLSGDPSFRDLVTRVRETALGAYAHQDLPFERLVEELAPARDPGRHPLCQVTVALQNAPAAGLELKGARTEPLGYEYRAVRFDLEVHLYDVDGAITGDLIYDTDLFAPATIAAWAGELSRLAERLALHPDEPLAALARARAAQTTAPPLPAPEATTFPELLRRRAEAAPRAIALESADGRRRLDYSELAGRARAVAAGLRARGIGRGDAVGVMCERSVEWIVAMLGILDAGAAYVPLDPDYPDERLRRIVAIAGLAAILDDRDEAGPRPDAASLADTAPILGCRDLARTPAAELPAPDPADPAYVMFTSGSTGRPKGVVVPHRALAWYATTAARTYALDGSSRLLQFSSPAFDISVEEVFATLAAGGTLVLRDPSMLGSPAAFLGACADRRITALALPTAFWHELARAVAADPALLPDSFRLVCFGGERVNERLVCDWLRAAGNRCRLMNTYGPTETTVVATVQELTREATEEDPRRAASIGRPLPGARVRVLDAALRPLPAGAVGEICIGGAGVALGYAGEPEATAAAFVPDPDPDRPGDRLYRTGDRGRLRADGTLEYLGRVDEQVKVRGYRVDPAEVEAALEACPQVADAAVVPWTDARGDTRLAGWFTPSPRAVADGDDADELVFWWRALYEDLYAHLPLKPAPGEDFNTIGWESTYDHAPLPEPAMREWVEDTVGRIRALGAARILEIGCGTGLLLWRLAPDCERYVGTDLSAAVVDYVRAGIRDRGWQERVHVETRAAGDFSGLEPGEIDAVVLNSVVQYFPGAAYLARVIEQAARLVAPGGALFVGDVRHLGLHEHLCAGVEVARADDDTPIEELRERVALRRAREQELLLEPGFWHRLAARLGRDARVRIELEGGRHDNELLEFRYDVTLELDRREPAAELEWIDWTELGRDSGGVGEIAALESRLRGGGRIGVRDVPNARLGREMRILERLHGSQPANGAGDRALPDPDAFRELGARCGRTVQVSWALGRPDGRYDILFGASLADRPVLPAPADANADRPLHNDPLGPQRDRLIEARVHEALAETLPRYMVPADLSVIDALPRTPNGKIDRARLPRPHSARAGTSVGSRPPADPTEKRLAQIWSELLGPGPVGVDDDFFRLGGHSLLAVRLMARIEDELGARLPLAELFRAPTVRQLAARLRRPAADRVRASANGGALVRIRRGNGGPPSFWVHPAGGHVLCYEPLARHLDGEGPFYGLESTALGDERTIAAMAHRYVESMLEVAPRGPYHLGGWSLGGVVAHAMACRLAERSADVRLVLIDAPVPGDDGRLPDEVRALAGLARELGLRIPAGTLAGCASAEEALASIAAGANGQLRALGLDRDRLLSLTRGYLDNLRALAQHTPAFFAGDALLLVPEDANGNDPGAQEKGWRRLAARLQRHTVPGDHFSMVRDPAVRRLAALVSRHVCSTHRGQVPYAEEEP